MWEFKQTPENGVLATDNDVHDGIGSIRKLIDIEDWYDGDTPDSIYEGRCKWCGCDRAAYSRHTELVEFVVTCINCDSQIEHS